VKIGPIFKGDSYERQKRGEKYWFEDAKKSAAGKPLGAVGNIHGLTNSL